MLEGTGLTLGDAAAHGSAGMNGALGWQTYGKFGPAVVVPSQNLGGAAISTDASASPSGAFTIETWVRRQYVRGTDVVDGEIAAQDWVPRAGPRWMLDVSKSHLDLR